MITLCRKGEGRASSWEKVAKCVKSLLLRLIATNTYGFRCQQDFCTEALFDNFLRMAAQPSAGLGSVRDKANYGTTKFDFEFFLENFQLAILVLRCLAHRNWNGASFCLSYRWMPVEEGCMISSFDGAHDRCTMTFQSYWSHFRIYGITSFRLYCAHTDCKADEKTRLLR